MWINRGGKKVKVVSHQHPLCLTFGVKSSVRKRAAATSVIAPSEANLRMHTVHKYVIRHECVLDCKKCSAVVKEVKPNIL